MTEHARVAYAVVALLCAAAMTIAACADDAAGQVVFFGMLGMGIGMAAIEAAARSGRRRDR